jgi:multidrug efflux system membrane fusion protein
MFKRLVLLALLVTACGAAYFFLAPFEHSPQAQTSRPPAGEQAQPVLAAVAVVKPVPVEIVTVGHVQTIASVAVRSRVDGQIAKVHVEDGQEVKVGDVMFTLDDRQATALLNQARSNLARDRAQLDYARKQVERYRALTSKDYYPREQFELAQSNAAALTATVKADEAQIANYETQLSYTVIRAPIDGRIGTIAFKTGNSVQASSTTSLVSLNQMRPIYVAFSIPQRELAEVQKALERGPVPTVATIPGDESEPQRGTVAYVENLIDQASGTISVKATFDNADNRLWPGQFVNVTLTVRVEPRAVTVPTIAIQSGQRGSYVFVIKPDSTVEQRPVTIGWNAGDETVVANGLAGDERVVTTGQLRLTNGTKVRIRRPDEQPPSAEPRS